MLLYILRHGAAEMRSRSGRDADRELTAEGGEKVRAVVRRAMAAGLEPELILASPYARAQQSARIAAKALGYSEEILTSTAFTPDAGPEDAWSEIRLHKDVGSILVATHLPLCGLLLGQLLGAPSLEVNFRKAALACVEVNAASAHPRATLEWMITPKLA
jgi:phosphohistidine phosphatase